MATSLDVRIKDSEVKAWLGRSSVKPMPSLGKVVDFVFRSLDQQREFDAREKAKIENAVQSEFNNIQDLDQLGKIFRIMRELSLSIYQQANTFGLLVNQNQTFGFHFKNCFNATGNNDFIRFCEALRNRNFEGMTQYLRNLASQSERSFIYDCHSISRYQSNHAISLLSIVCEFNDLEAVRHFLDTLRELNHDICASELSPSAKYTVRTDRYRIHPIEVACHQGNLEIINLLFERGSRITHLAHSIKIFLAALEFGDREILDKILDWIGNHWENGSSRQAKITNWLNALDIVDKIEQKHLSNISIIQSLFQYFRDQNFIERITALEIRRSSIQGVEMCLSASQNNQNLNTALLQKALRELLNCDCVITQPTNSTRIMLNNRQLPDNSFRGYYSPLRVFNSDPSLGLIQFLVNRGSLNDQSREDLLLRYLQSFGQHLGRMSNEFIMISTLKKDYFSLKALSLIWSNRDVFSEVCRSYVPSSASSCMLNHMLDILIRGLNSSQETLIDVNFLVGVAREITSSEHNFEEQGKLALVIKLLCFLSCFEPNDEIDREKVVCIEKITNNGHIIRALRHNPINNALTQAIRNCLFDDELIEVIRNHRLQVEDSNNGQELIDALRTIRM